jgi:hypothetical protein
MSFTPSASRREGAIASRRRRAVRSAGSHSGVVAIENPGSITPSLDEPVVMAVYGQSWPRQQTGLAGSTSVAANVIGRYLPRRPNLV